MVPLLAAGCGDNIAVVTVQVDPAATILVLEDPDGGWRALESGSYLVEIEPTGPYGIAQLSGPVASVILAGLDDPREWVLWNSPAPGTPLHTVTVQLADTVASADVTIGNVATVVVPTGPSTLTLPEGLADVVAFRGDQVIVLHDVAIAAGLTIDLDFAVDAHALVPRGVAPDSPFVAPAQLVLQTRRGTRGTSSFLGELPAAALEPGDRQWLQFDTDAGDVGIDVDLERALPGPLHLPEPTAVAATVDWEDDVMVARWDPEQPWATRRLYVSAGQPPAPRTAWSVSAHPGWAAQPGSFALPLGGAVDGWDDAYVIAPDRELAWWTLELARPVDAAIAERASTTWVNTAPR